MVNQKNYILSEKEASMKIHRMAYEIAEHNFSDEARPLIIAGIRDNGVVIAHALRKVLAVIYPAEVQVIEISLDKRNPGEIVLSEEMDFSGKTVIVVDDVANSGKTMLYALKPFLNFHPASIQTLALVERTHKAYPIHTDYVGVSLSTTLQEHIFVEVKGEVVTGAYLQ